MTHALDRAGAYPVFGQCQLIKSGSNLLLIPKGGNLLTVNGVPCTVPDAGVSLAPTGFTVGVTQFIYAVATNGVITSIEGGTTGHATSTTAGNRGNEVRSGDETRTLVGIARPITGPAWADTAAQRLVRSWHNRERLSVAGAIDTTSTETNTGTYIEKTVSKAEFVCWANEAVLACVNGMLTNTSSAFAGLNLMLDGAQVGPGLDWNTLGASNRVTYGNSMPTIAAADGYHYVSFGLRTVGGGTVSVATYQGMQASALVG